MSLPLSRILDAEHARVTLSLEPLEPRLLLSGGDWLDLASLTVSPEWFGAMPGEDAGYADVLGEYGTRTVDLRAGSVEVIQDHWIVQFTSAAVDGMSSVAETAGLLTPGIGFELVRGLGMMGQVLLRTPGADAGAVESWLSANTSVAGYAADAIITLDAVTPNDPSFSPHQWYLHNTGQSGGTADADIDAPQAWTTTTGSSTILVGVIDTGVDYTHPDLVGNMWVNALEQGGLPGVDDDLNGFIDDIYGYDFYDGDGDPMDEDGHGTHVAGTIGAVGNNSLGVTGVAWNVSIMAIRFLGPGGGSTADAISAVNYTTMMKNEYADGSGDGTPGADVRITNNSWGGGAFDAGLETAISAYGAAGGLFVAAAGNDGLNNDIAAFYPATYDQDNMISVAATDHNDNLVAFSNYGVDTVDVAAPGHGIYSTWLGGTYSFLSGTSMASPVVAGVAALAWSANPGASMSHVRDAVIAGAEPLASLSGLVATSGRVNARATLNRVMLADPIHVPVASFLSGPVTVDVFDAQGYINVDSSAVVVKFGTGSEVKKVQFGGGSSDDGIGIAISGASYVKSIKDARKGTAHVAYVAVDSAVGRIKLQSGMSGANLNGATLGGLVLPADIDGDGVTSDFTGLYVVGATGKVDVKGNLGTDAYFGSLGRMKLKGGSSGDIVSVGSAGRISMRGSALGDISIGGSNSKFDIRGSIYGAVSIGGSAGKMRIRGSMQGYWNDNVISTMDIAGGVRAVRVDGIMWYGSRVTSGGSIRKFDAGMAAGLGILSETTIYSNGVQVLAAGDIGRVNIGPVDFPDVAASGLRLMAGADLGADYMIGGTGLDTDTFTPARIGSVNVGGHLANSLISAGATSMMGSLDLSAAQSYGGFLLGSIGKITIGGNLTAAVPGLQGIGAYTIGELEVTRVKRIYQGVRLDLVAMPVYYTTL